MKRKVGDYRLLATSSWWQGFFRGSLWLGGDDLLLVRNHGYVEHYQRLTYSDIQALIIRRSSRRAIFGFIFGVPGFVALLWAALSFGEPRAVFLSVLAAILLIPFAVNLAKGPGAVVTAQTAVGRHRLPAIRRLRQVERAIPHLDAVIREKQGEIPEEALATDRITAQAPKPVAAGSHAHAPTKSPPHSKPAASVPVPPPPLPIAAGGLGEYRLIFLLITLQALLVAGRFYIDSLLLDISILLAAPVAFFLACMTAAKWKRLPPALRGWLVAAIVYHGLLGSFFYGIVIMAGIEGNINPVRPEAYSAWAVLHIVIVAMAAMIGLGGFFNSRRIALKRGT